MKDLDKILKGLMDDDDDEPRRKKHSHDDDDEEEFDLPSEAEQKRMLEEFLAIKINLSRGDYVKLTKLGRRRYSVKTGCITMVIDVFDTPQQDMDRSGSGLIHGTIGIIEPNPETRKPCVITRSVDFRYFEKISSAPVLHED